MKRYVFLFIAIVLAAIYLFPLYWMYVTALKSGSDIFQYPPAFWPAHPRLQLAQVFATYQVDRYVWNSFVVALGTTFITVLLGTGAAYVLANVSHPLVTVALFAILMLQVLPPSLMVTPIFVAFITTLPAPLIVSTPSPPSILVQLLPLSVLTQRPTEAMAAYTVGGVAGCTASPMALPVMPGLTPGADQVRPLSVLFRTPAFVPA